MGQYAPAKGRRSLFASTKEIRLSSPLKICVTVFRQCRADISILMILKQTVRYVTGDLRDVHGTEGVWQQTKERRTSGILFFFLVKCFITTAKKVMFSSAFDWLFVCLIVFWLFLIVCLLTGLYKNYSASFHKILIFDFMLVVFYVYVIIWFRPSCISCIIHIFYFCIFGSYSFLSAVLLFYGIQFNGLVAFLLNVK